MPIVIMVGGRTVHPCCVNVALGSFIFYFFIFCVVTVCGKRSLQYVNSNICILRLGCGRIGGLLVSVVPLRHSISWQSLAK